MQVARVGNTSAEQLPKPVIPAGASLQSSQLMLSKPPLVPKLGLCPTAAMEAGKMHCKLSNSNAGKRLTASCQNCFSTNIHKMSAGTKPPFLTPDTLKAGQAKLDPLLSEQASPQNSPRISSLRRDASLCGTILASSQVQAHKRTQPFQRQPLIVTGFLFGHV